MNVEIQHETPSKIKAALRAVIDQYADDDYAEGDSYAVRLCREALAAIEADQAPTPPQRTTDNGQRTNNQ